MNKHTQAELAVESIMDDAMDAIYGKLDNQLGLSLEETLAVLRGYDVEDIYREWYAEGED